MYVDMCLHKNKCHSRNEPKTKKHLPLGDNFHLAHTLRANRHLHLSQVLIGT
jgi:hypothetical protein